jgi:2-aminoadipate transaminase
MPIPYRLSTSIANLKRSPMRDLLALTANRPNIISLAGGLPADECLPLEAIRTCIDAVLTRDGARALQYGPQYAPLKDQIVRYMHQRGVLCTADEIFVTNGNQQGLEIVTRLLLEPDDLALVEEYTFTGIVQTTHGRGARLHTLPVDLATGVDVDAFESAHALNPRLAVIIPDFHNPLGVSLSESKRIRLANLAAAHRLPIIEDDPYSALRFEGQQLPPIKAYDEAGAVIYLGSFSKMLAPALRLGWIVAPRELLPKLAVIRESIDLEASQLTQRAVAEFLARGYLDPHLTRLNTVNHSRRDALIAACERELGGLAHWTRPEGGLFVWLTLPDEIDTQELFKTALEQSIAFVPGQAFAVNQGKPNHSMRLNFSNTSPDKIDEVIRRLANLVKEQLAVAA